MLLCLAAWLAPAAAQAQTDLLVLGDSLVAGYGLEDSAAFPAVLERALAERGHDVTVTNAGVSGETSAGLRARLDWALAETTDAAIVVTGGNDALRGLDPAQLRENLAAVVEALNSRDIPVLLAGMLAPRNFGSEYSTAFDTAFEEAGGKAAVFYPFFLEGVATVPALNQPDGIHPNAEGVREIVDRMLPAVERLLAAVDGG